MRFRSCFIIAGFLLMLVLTVAGQDRSTPAERRVELEQVLRQRYQVTTIGPHLMGFSGNAGSIRHAGGVTEARRAGLYGALDQKGATTSNIRGELVEVTRGQKDFAFPAGEQFYVHSVYVGEDVITLGLVTTRSIATPRGAGRLWAAVNFFLPPQMISNVDTGAIYGVLDQWLLPQGQRPEPAAAAAAPPVPSVPPQPSAPTPATRADLKPEMSRDEILGLLGPPQREASYGPRTWLTYPGMVIVLENGKLVSVDRSGQPPANVTVRSEPDGADVYLGDSFVGSTPAMLELPAGTYKFSVRLPGYKDWQRDVQVLSGSELTLRARLEK